MTNLKWYKLQFSITYKNLSPRMKSHYISTLSSAIKSVIDQTNLQENKNKILFHFTDLRLNEQPILNQPYSCEVIITIDDHNTSKKFANQLIEYFLNPVNEKNIQLSKEVKIISQNLNDIKKKYHNLKGINELVLDFFSPVDFSKHVEKHRTLLTKEKFFSLIIKRLNDLFDIKIEHLDLTKIFFYPYFWHYTYFKHLSKSQFGHIQYIQGCLGPVLLKGDLENLLDLILIASEIHISGKGANFQGYFKIRDGSFIDELYKDTKKLKNYPYLIKGLKEQNKLKLTEETKLQITERLLINTINRHLQLNSKSEFSEIKENSLIDFLDYCAMMGYHYYVVLDENNLKEILSKINPDEILKIFPGNNEIFLRYFKKILTIENLGKYQSLYKIVEFILNEKNSELKIKVERLNNNFLIFFDSEENVHNFIEKNLINKKLEIYSIFEKNTVSGIEIKAVEFDTYESPDTKTLFIKIPHIKLKKSSESVVLEIGERELTRMPLNLISDIVILSPTQISSSLISELSERDIGILIATKNGFITTKVCNSNFFYHTGVHFQRYHSLSFEERLHIAKEFIRCKLINYQYILFNKKISECYKTGLEIGKKILKIKEIRTLEELLGLEGITSKIIYDTYRNLILNKDFQFTKRDSQSNEPYNILLNFIYSLLAKDINIRLRLNDINPYLGFLHSPDNKYESLVYDILELFRCIGDKTALKLVNLKIVSIEDFINTDDEFTKIKDEAIIKIIKKYYESISERKYGGYNILQIMDKIVLLIKNWINQQEFRLINFIDLKNKKNT